MFLSDTDGYCWGYDDRTAKSFGGRLGDHLCIEGVSTKLGVGPCCSVLPIGNIARFVSVL